MGESEIASTVQREPWEPGTDHAPHSRVKEFAVLLEDSARLLKDGYFCLLTYLFVLPKF